ncbi:MAG: hypothetical protein OXG49_06750 [Chloroflexi bacterium]|nr:hypothetical protein [Chloroflexota bacterium]
MDLSRVEQALNSRFGRSDVGDYQSRDEFFSCLLTLCVENGWELPDADEVQKWYERKKAERDSAEMEDPLDEFDAAIDRAAEKLAHVFNFAHLIATEEALREGRPLPEKITDIGLKVGTFKLPPDVDVEKALREGKPLSDLRTDHKHEDEGNA